MKKAIFIALFILFVAGWSVNVSAHALVDVYALLEVEEPSLLPNSPFYFFKSVERGFKIFFTFDAAKKAELELKFLDEKLAETHKLSETTDDPAALERAFQNYLEAHGRLQARLESLKGKNKNVDALLEKLAARVIDHQKLFDELEKKLGKEVEKATEELAKGVRKALELDREKFKEKLKEKIRKERDDDPDDLEALEELEELDEGLKEELGDLEKDLGELKEGGLRGVEDGLEELKKIEKEIGGDSEKKQEDKVAVCIQLYDPVCGVDEKTYSNDCFAGLAGVQIKHKGECAVSSQETEVKPAPLPPPLSASVPEPITFTVEADDNGFYPGTALAVAKGAQVKITFNVRSTNVYFGGLDFRSDKFKTAAVPPGGQTTVEFSADESFTVTSYWPASGVRKADLKIEVK